VTYPRHRHNTQASANQTTWAQYEKTTILQTVQTLYSISAKGRYKGWQHSQVKSTNTLLISEEKTYLYTHGNKET